MTELERQNILTYVESYRNALPEQYKAYWHNWLSDRDTVAKKLNLTQEQILYVTKRQMTDLVLVVLKDMSGFNKMGADAFAKTNGTTKVLSKMRELVEISKEIGNLIPKTLKRFDAEMEKLHKKSR